MHVSEPLVITAPSVSRVEFILFCSCCGRRYMAERMGVRSKELVVEKAALEAAVAKEEVRRCQGRSTRRVFSRTFYF